jgi:hypothetical protein
VLSLLYHVLGKAELEFFFTKQITATMFFSLSHKFWAYVSPRYSSGLGSYLAFLSAPLLIIQLTGHKRWQKEKKFIVLMRTNVTWWQFAAISTDHNCAIDPPIKDCEF